MTTSEILIEQITNSVDDDATISAALDALREERGYDHLDAVLAVAAAWHAGRQARTLQEAVQYLACGSPDKAWLQEEIALSASSVPDNALLQVVVVNGDDWPSAKDMSLCDGPDYYPMWTVTVGAGWIIRTVAAERDRRTSVNKRARRFKAQ